MKLYNFWRSTCSWRVRIALALKGLPYTYQAVHLSREGGEQNREQYQVLNPARTVPLLEIEEGGQVWRLSQSMAILEYLEELHPNPALLPSDPRARAKARQLAELVNSGIQPLQNLAVIQHVKQGLHGDSAAWAQHWIARGLQALERQVQETAMKFCVGNELSFADIYLVPQLGGARRFKVDLSAYPTLLRVEAACTPLPAFEQAHPERQPDAEGSMMA
jgi:maleylpyruvate isomerase